MYRERSKKEVGGRGRRMQSMGLIDSEYLGLIQACRTNWKVEKRYSDTGLHVLLCKLCSGALS